MLSKFWRAEKGWRWAELSEQPGIEITHQFNKPALHRPYNNSNIFFFVPLQKNSFLIKGRHRKKSIAKDFSVPLPPQVL